jgi:hypothetical protein
MHRKSGSKVTSNAETAGINTNSDKIISLLRISGKKGTKSD